MKVRMRALAITAYVTPLAVGGCSSSTNSGGTFDFSGTCQGTWDSVSGASGGFSTTLVQTQMNITGSIDIPDLSTTREPLSGSVNGFSVQFGDVNHTIQFQGGIQTTSPAGYAMNGTYKYPATSDSGNWTATCVSAAPDGGGSTAFGAGGSGNSSYGSGGAGSELACASTGEPCTNSVCCSGSLCVNFLSSSQPGERCDLICTTALECATGCCADVGGSSVCAPADQCSNGSGGASGSGTGGSSGTGGAGAISDAGVALDAGNKPLCARVGRLGTTDARDVAVRGTTLFIADGAAGLKIADATNAYAPTLTGTLPAPKATVVAVALGDTYLYAYDVTAGLLVVDISDLTHPTIKGSVPLYNVDSGFPPSDDPGNGALAVSGNTAYVGGIMGVGVCTVDVSNPASPALVGSCATDVDWASGFAVRGGFLYAASVFNFYVLNIQSTSGPLTVGTLSQECQGNFGMLGPSPFVAGISSCFLVDTASPVSPSVAGIVDTVYAYATAVTGTVGYAATDMGLSIIDLSAPSAPRIIGSCSSTDSSPSRLQVGGNQAYTTLGSSGVSVWQLYGAASISE